MDGKDAVRQEQEKSEVLFSEEQIKERVCELAEQISNDYKNNEERDLVLMGILKGAYIFTSDLSRNVTHPNLFVDFMRVSSYPQENDSTGEPMIVSDSTMPIYGKDVIIVEDIVDTGYSMDTLLKILSARNPYSLKVCSLLSKPNRRKVEVPIDYLGFSIKDLWVVGYGLDSGEKGRTGKDIIFYKK